jgi:predicted PurR-regulated permease PerM
VASKDETLGFTSKVLIAALAVALLLVMWRVAEVFLVAFGAILMAIMLRSIAAPLSVHLRISNQIALVLATLGLLVATFCFLIVFGTQAAAQFSLLIAEIPEGLEQARAWLRTSPIGRSALELWDSTQRQAASTLLTALPFAGGVLGALGNFALIIVVGIYLAADPDTYVNGAVRLLPVEKRKRARFVLDEWRWMRFFSGPLPASDFGRSACLSPSRSACCRECRSSFLISDRSSRLCRAS